MAVTHATREMEAKATKDSILSKEQIAKLQKRLIECTNRLNLARASLKTRSETRLIKNMMQEVTDAMTKIEENIASALEAEKAFLACQNDETVSLKERAEAVEA